MKGQFLPFVTTLADLLQGKVADSLLQRLILKPAKIEILAEGIRAIAAQDEPVGRLISQTEVAAGGCS